MERWSIDVDCIRLQRCVERPHANPNPKLPIRKFLFDLPDQVRKHGGCSQQTLELVPQSDCEFRCEAVTVLFVQIGDKFLEVLLHQGALPSGQGTRLHHIGDHGEILEAPAVHG